jgi:predicted  nucleic acid-binding Zn-ribbon protein
MSAAPEDDYTMVDGQAFDGLGNPMVRLDGCPNCGKGKGWHHPIEYFGKKNSGVPVLGDGPCSRRCELQIEHAKALAARDAVEVAEAITQTAASTPDQERT